MHLSSWRACQWDLELKACGPHLWLRQRATVRTESDRLAYRLNIAAYMLSWGRRRRCLGACPDQAIDTAPDIVVWAIVYDSVGSIVRNDSSAGPTSMIYN